MNTYSDKKNRRAVARGFTLMEVMVAVSIFAIVVTIGISSLLTINNSYKKSQTDRQAIDSLTYILESMSRRIRTAQLWDTAHSSSTEFRFTDQDGIEMAYRWDPTDRGSIWMDIITNPAVATISLVPTGNYNLTPENVSIATTNPDGVTVFPGGGLRFTTVSAGGPSYVQINLGGFVTNGRTISDFAFQTGISKRALDQ